ncbi:MAG TPA: VOC family protein, partial [Leptospiraceae bacterium]|nr:VOC family protein [Leptospiraceae bacterium]
ELIFHKDSEKAKRSTEAMMKMQKIDIATLNAAAS